MGFLLWVLFCVCFLCIILCKNYYKPIIIQYYVVSCVSWVPRLTLLDLQTTWTYECTLRRELVHM